MSEALLEVQGLHVRIGSVHAVRGADLRVAPGECLALVGESGCGKSMTALSLMGLQPLQARVEAQAWRFGEQQPSMFSPPQWQRFRGNRMAMIFQNPMVALNPTMRVGDQIAEPLRVHRGMNRRDARNEAVRLLERMAIPSAARRARQYPFEFSGGMLQRVMIAVAVACEPELLIADEPTTALDVTVQAEVLDLLDELRRERGMALILITHDLGVVARMADRVSVMYAGEVVEEANTDRIFYRTAHPYTRALKAAVPTMEREGSLPSIQGSPPDLRRDIQGCPFRPRCDYAMAICRETPPNFRVTDAHLSRCWLWHPDCPEGGLNE